MGYVFSVRKTMSNGADTIMNKISEYRVIKTCIKCGCTDDRACPGGCWWHSQDPPICSACVPESLGGTGVEVAA
jgi:hypothetical protein